MALCRTGRHGRHLSNEMKTNLARARKKLTFYRLENIKMTPLGIIVIGRRERRGGGGGRSVKQQLKINVEKYRKTENNKAQQQQNIENIQRDL